MELELKKLKDTISILLYFVASFISIEILIYFMVPNYADSITIMISAIAFPILVIIFILQALLISKVNLNKATRFLLYEIIIDADIACYFLVQTIHIVSPEDLFNLFTLLLIKLLVRCNHKMYLWLVQGGNKNMKYLQKNLKILRADKSYRSLAEETGVNYNKLYRLENVKAVNPFLNDIIKLAAYFHISLGDLLHKDLTK